MFSSTTAVKRISEMTKRIRIVQGGTSAGKSIAILLYFIHRAQSDKTPTLASIVSESFPHLRRGVMKDFLEIMSAHGYYKEDRWSKTTYTYTFETGSRIEFFSADQPDKVRGPRRDRLWINEFNNVPYDAFDQLEVRTKDFIFGDFNPVSEFYFFTEILPKRDDVDHITLTYKDNEALDKSIVASIEQRRSNKNWWRVYGEGQLGQAENRIYKDWQIIDEIPHEARLERYGLDFGYTNDPTAICAVYAYNGGFILDEVCYRKGLSNRQIADLLLNLERTLVCADSAEPKSIDELKSYGLDVVPCAKGPGSVNQGIQYVQDQKISVTKRSVNLIKEYRNYLWRTDRDGKIINEPEGGNCHVLDAARYALESYRPRVEYPIGVYDFAPPEY